MLSKKHFIKLADYIKTSPVPFTKEHLEVLADFCRSENPQFNRGRFLGYIAGENGPSGGTIKKPKASKVHPLDRL
ncbi:MAG: hypothetical protein CV089_02080 [Nitrospira sp. WS110]|nr:hypothetical protein [Nitrospira sp. WS110]